MKNLCRYAVNDGAPAVGLIEGDTVLDLGAAGITRLSTILEEANPDRLIDFVRQRALPRHSIGGVRLLAPVEGQEVWAAGVTYLRSKAARMEESDFSARAYDHVYEAARPELFFKALPGKVAGPGEAVGIRNDARWSVPEPELALVLNSRGDVAGYTIGNDMSSRDIEGENLLYLPQAKIYERSCALGPCLVLGVPEAEARTWSITLTILRQGAPVFSGHTSVGRIKRSFTELAQYLFRSQTFPGGAVLLTGTGIVPPNDFTLQPGDDVRIAISGIGELRNTVATV